MAAGPRKRLQRVAGRCGSRDLLAATMRPLIVKQLKYDLTPVAGLALVGPPPEAAGAGVQAARQGAAGEDGRVQQRHRAQLRRTARARQVGIRLPSRTSAGTRSSSIAGHRIGLLPSSVTLRQRLDARAADLLGFVPALIETLLSSARPDYGVLSCGWLPQDVDTFAMDTAAPSRKAWAGPTPASTATARWWRTWARTGFCLELALRPGVQHSSLETPFNYERVIPMAQRLSAAGRRRRSDPGGGQGGKRPGGADLQRPRLRDLFAAAPELAPPARKSGTPGCLPRLHSQGLAAAAMPSGSTSSRVASMWCADPEIR